VPLRAVLFDLDGVLTDTASVHFRAWKETFDALLKGRPVAGGESFRDFSRGDYLGFVDGKPRYEGVASFLAARGIDLPPGEPSDPPEAETVCGVGNRKNRRFGELLERDGAQVFAGSVRLLEALADAGIACAVVSSSRNARPILERAGLNGFAAAVVDGVAAARRGLAGKPEPETFLTAAADLGVPPARAVVVEDALSGVEAGARGGFGLVLGVTRGVPPDELLAAGADRVVADLAEVSLDDLTGWFEDELPRDLWRLVWHGFDPARERTVEALTTVGNGVFATRGAVEEAWFGEVAVRTKDEPGVGYPGTYAAGVYDRQPSPVHGRAEHEDLVNLPNWLPVRCRLGDGPWLDGFTAEIARQRRELDLRTGVLRREALLRDAGGREVEIVSERFVSRADPRRAALRWRVTPCGFRGAFTVRAALDGSIENLGVPRYRDLTSKHLEVLTTEADGEEARLVARTFQSGHRIALTARHRFRLEGQPVSGVRPWVTDTAAGGEVTVELGEGETLEVEKLVTFQVERSPAGPPSATVPPPDPGEEEPSRSPLYPEGGRGRPPSGPRGDRGGIFPGEDSYEGVAAAHRTACARLWERADLEIEGDRRVQKLVRFALHHLLVTAGPVAGPSGELTAPDLDAGIPGRGLHGEGYRGHVFWDELYILPVYLAWFPEVARSVLLYRLRRLDAARALARSEEGLPGALYPWQSGSDGGEETPAVHLNPRSGTWDPDLSRRQRHVSLAVAVNLLRYVETTGDEAFLLGEGKTPGAAEAVLEIARFWGAKAQRDEATGRWSIHGVMGPDEFHERYPGTEEGGLTDNAYTNVLAAWLLGKMPELLARLPADARDELSRRLELGEDELARWREVASGLTVPASEDGVIEQFAGFFELDELDWEGLRREHGPGDQAVARLDRILKARGDSPDRVQAIKQADVLMLFYVLSPEELGETLERLGFRHARDPELLARNFDTYEPRTSHGSTLSALVHGRLAWRLGREEPAMRFFRQTLEADYDDVQGGTTAEGIHTGAMAGAVLWVLEDFAGLDLRGEEPVVRPAPTAKVPSHLHRITCRFQHRGRRYRLVAGPEGVEELAIISPDRPTPPRNPV